MPREYLLFVEDNKTAIAKIERYTKGMNKQEFVRNDLVFDAVIRNLEIIGEAVKKIPSNVKSNFKQQDWKKIAGLRDIISHAYFGIDADIIWNIISEKLNPLKHTINAILNEERKTDTQIILLGYL